MAHATVCARGKPKQSNTDDACVRPRREAHAIFLSPPTVCSQARARRHSALPHTTFTCYRLGMGLTNFSRSQCLRATNPYWPPSCNHHTGHVRGQTHDQRKSRAGSRVQQPCPLRDS